MDDLAPSVRK